MNEDEILTKEYNKHIDEILKSTNRVVMNKDKIECFFYNSSADKKLYSIYNSKNKILNYLGFSFDGTTVKIREKSLFKYYSRVYKKVKNIKKFNGHISEFARKKSLYRIYTHLGDKKFSSKKGKNRYGNFITYARRSKEIFDKSMYLDNEICGKLNE